MTRRPQVIAGATCAPLVVATGWLFTLVVPGVAFALRAQGLMPLGPAVGIVVGTIAMRRPVARMKGALLLAVSLFSALTCGLLLAGAPAWSLLGSS